jgi:hypothetical protein
MRCGDFSFPAPLPKNQTAIIPRHNLPANDTKATALSVHCAPIAPFESFGWASNGPNRTVAPTENPTAIIQRHNLPANDTKATALSGHCAPVAPFESFGWAS